MEVIHANNLALRYFSPVEMALDDRALLSGLIHETPWRQENICLYGKTYQQPRLIAWYGDAGRSYTYSGTTHHPLPWTRSLLELKGLVEKTCGGQFNSVLLNYYRNENDSMGMHSDDEPELGTNPVIASLSLGERRTLVFKYRRGKPQELLRLPLDSGSLLVMEGPTQHYWKHGIYKERRPCGSRLNLTFRTILGL